MFRLPFFQNSEALQVRPNVVAKSIVPRTDLAYDDLRKVNKRWLVTDKVQVGRRTNEGRLVRCSPLMIQKGDFVDISVVADIATFCSSGEQGGKVHFSLEQVIQLAEARRTEVRTLAHSLVLLALIAIL